MTSCDAPKTLTLKLMDAVLLRLKEKIPEMDREFFPEKPSAYVLTHVKGAFLLAYGKSSFSQPVDTGIVAQVRTVTLTITTMMRMLNDREGVVSMNDRLREALVGFKPPNCRRKIWVESEHFLGEDSGVWSYQTMIATELMQIEAGD